MNIVHRSPDGTADISGARGGAFRELRKLTLFTVLLVTGLYLLIGFVVDLAVERIPFETEARLFKALVPAGSQSGDDAGELARARRVLDRLSADSLVPALPWRLTVIDSPDPNAFAFPGGTIGVTRGLLEALDDDLALGFVLAHELGHFQHRDHLRGAGRTLGFGIALRGLFGGHMGSSSIGNMYHYVIGRSYSRHQEERADRFGVELVKRVFGSTDGVQRLFELLEEQQELPAWGYMFATHPSPRQRIQDLKEHALALEEHDGTE